MIVVKEFPKRQFASIGEVHKAIRDNITYLIELKKSAVKFTDGFNLHYAADSIDREFSIKAAADANEDNPTEIKRKVVMNTTNLLDSHGDVHGPGLWKRTLEHSNRKLHLQEHRREFDKVIASDAKAYTKMMPWADLGALEFTGSTQALIFETLIKQSRNPLMFDQYKNGWVENHSVGMQYVNYSICINSEENWAKEYKENYEKYIGKVANREEAERRTYFWWISEAKLLEGSAVLFGSNWVTPTLNEDKSELEESPLTLDPEKSTQTKNKEEFFNYHL